MLDAHEWGEVYERLHGLSQQYRWSEMGSLVSDDMLGEFAVIAPQDELADAVKARYDGLLDRVGYYFPFVLGEREIIWRSAAGVFGSYP